MRINRPIIGWIFYDFANSAFATTILAVIFSQYFAGVIAGGAEGVKLHLFGKVIQIPGASLWGYLVSISTLIVAITSPLMGAIADLGGWRKRLLMLYCYLGVIATMGLSLAGPGDIWLASLLFILADLGFGGGNVFYNAFLLDVSPKGDYGKVSGLAWGFGYLGGGLCLGLNLVMLKFPHLLGQPEGFFSVADCILVSGVWWGIFAIPTMLWLRDPAEERARIKLSQVVVAAWRRLRQTLREVKKYRHLTRFLLAYLIFNDGIETVIVMASIFGSEVVGLSAGELVLFFLIIQGTALVGSLGFGWLGDRIGNRPTLLITLVIWLGVVSWAFKLGWLFDPRTDYYIIGVLAGSVLGGSQSAARAMQASFTPPGRAAEFFGFFGISGRFASIFATALYSTVIILAGGVQAGILILGLFFLVGGVLLWFVDEAAGIESAGP